MRDAMIDLSHWNSRADFATAKAGGIEAVCLKASEGADGVDNLYPTRAQAAERNRPRQRSATPDEAARTIVVLEAEFPAATIVYCGRWQSGLPHPLLARRPLILPKYGAPPGNRDLPPGWTMPMLLAWQHTDGVSGYRPAPVAGIGRCDRSMVFLEAAALAEWWRGGAAVPAPGAASR